jgi:hypothetical protein
MTAADRRTVLVAHQRRLTTDRPLPVPRAPPKTPSTRAEAKSVGPVARESIDPVGRSNATSHDVHLASTSRMARTGAPEYKHPAKDHTFTPSANVTLMNQDIKADARTRTGDPFITSERQRRHDRSRLLVVERLPPPRPSSRAHSSQWKGGGARADQSRSSGQRPPRRQALEAENR